MQTFECENKNVNWSCSCVLHVPSTHAEILDKVHLDFKMSRCFAKRLKFSNEMNFTFSRQSRVCSYSEMSHRATSFVKM